MVLISSFDRVGVFFGGSVGSFWDPEVRLLRLSGIGDRGRRNGLFVTGVVQEIGEEDQDK